MEVIGQNKVTRYFSANNKWQVLNQSFQWCVLSFSGFAGTLQYFAFKYWVSKH